MAKRHRDLLIRLDAIGLNRYQITEQDVEIVEAYLHIIQAGLVGETTWQEMVRYGSYYGTSILVHEIVEIRQLVEKGLQPLHQKTRILRRLLAQHVDAHVMALYEEHLYLQEVINRLYGQMFEVATLVRANRNDELDLQLFLESDIGLFLLEEKRIAEARQALTRLKGEIPV